jgi:hypothetical protein
MHGKLGIHRYVPARIRASGMPTPIERARTSTSPAFGSGTGASMYLSTSGGPGCVNWTIFMRRRLLYPLVDDVAGNP